ncbi:MAG TPA: hypothetical protein PKI34_11970 [Bacteroidales bacterium]|nr:hypothetical protein [Bacteroidales bacterium]
MDEKILWSIGFVLFVIILCIVKPNIGRIFLGIFYLIMAIGINIVNAITDPQSTVQMGEASLIGFYRILFSEVVSKVPVLFILAIALFQITMGLLILNKHKYVKYGLVGTSIFLILITPFGHIQIPWLGIAAIQLYLLTKDFDKTFIEIVGSVFRRDKHK